MRILGQSNSEEILRDHLAKHDVHVELDTRLDSFVQDADNVTARLVHHHHGDEESSESVRVQYLVSAEGAKSERSCVTFDVRYEMIRSLKVLFGSSLA